MKAIRIEKDGKGPFTSYATPYSMLDRHHKFPSLKEDFPRLGISIYKYYCAYKSVEQLKEWITKDELDTLYELGFEVFELTLSSWEEGSMQIFYKKEDVIHTHRLTL